MCVFSMIGFFFCVNWVFELIGDDWFLHSFDLSRFSDCVSFLMFLHLYVRYVVYNSECNGTKEIKSFSVTKRTNAYSSSCLDDQFQQLTSYYTLQLKICVSNQLDNQEINYHPD